MPWKSRFLAESWKTYSSTGKRQNGHWASLVLGPFGPSDSHVLATLGPFGPSSGRALCPRALRALGHPLGGNTAAGACQRPDIDQYWSGLLFTKVTDSVSKQLICRVLINIDQYWSILIKNFVYQSHGICFKTTYMPSPDQYWSILIIFDQYRLILIRTRHISFFETESVTLVNEGPGQYWSIVISINQYWSILSHGFCFITANMPSPDQYWSILINIDWYWSLLINIDQEFRLPKSRILFQNN